MKSFSIKLLFTKTWLAKLLLIFLVASTFLTNAIAAPDTPEKKILYWYDPMVPDQHFDKPGKSPFMDMELVPKYASVANAAADTSPAVDVDTRMQQQLGIRTSTVQSKDMASAIHASGRLTVDEKQMVRATVRTDGYVEELHVRAVGEHVEKGEKLASIYAPQLQTAQAEYLLALHNGTLPESRARLLRLGMAEQDIAALTSSQKILSRIGLYAPISGFVMELAVREGSSVTAGMAVMQIAAHHSVWQIIDVPERYAQDVHIGQQADITLDSQPGAVLHGSVQYIYPELDNSTRSVRVRIVLDNTDRKLMPGMYAQTTLRTQARNVLSVPTEAIIATGTRTVVIVKDNNHFRPAAVVTGIEQNGDTEIISGLHADETVVTSGQFLMDSEASLSGVLARMDSEAQP
ncbi:MAG TPA: efflux RND transporter periplasmic adaptor subunit [Pseudomonadales bacterium]|nr:efflux RND transporter periplasmic adaptor subunit [Pseudomonadales bacterium]